MKKDLEYFLTKASLYEKINLVENETLSEELTPSQKPVFQVDMYCPKCKKETPFHLTEMSSVIVNSTHSVFGPNTEDITEKIANRLIRAEGYSIILRCGKNGNHLHLYRYKFNENYVIKFGQYPSLADLEIFDTKKYSKILAKDYMDYTKAIGLHAHGVGAGSYVYLRRIFENIVFETYEEVSQSENWVDDNFITKKMADKIKVLKDYLPAIITENTSLYGILSIGIHELDEQQCLEFFPVMRAAIEMILDEKLRKKEEENKFSKLKQAIGSISSKIGEGR